MKHIGVMGLVESHFGPFGDNITVGARLVHGLRQSTIGSEIILDAPDGTPRRRSSSGNSFRSLWR
jgi:hypothetical protein